MASDPPIEPPKDDASEAVEPVAEPAAAAPAEPVSKGKEWAVAFAIMIVFAIICAKFIMYLRINQVGGGIGP